MAVSKLFIRLYLRSVYGLVAVLRAVSSGLEQLGSWRFKSPQEVASGSHPAPPKRVAIVVAEHDASCVPEEMAAKVLHWCYQADIELVSLYDPAGYLKARLQLIQQHLEEVFSASIPQARVGSSTDEARKDADGPIGQRDDDASNVSSPAAVRPAIVLQAGWRSPQPLVDSGASLVAANAQDAASAPQGQPASRPGLNDASAQGNAWCRYVSLRAPECAGGVQGDEVEEDDACMRVVVLSAEDAYKPVLETIQFASKDRLGPIKTPERSHQEASLELQHRLRAVAGPEAVQEPQLILVYGSAPLTLAGFPPWQARVAEIQSMGPLQSATGSKFRATMDKFCSIKQRFGK